MERLAEHRPCDNAGMELSVFAARIHALRQLVDKGMIERSPDERGGELLRIDARDDGDNTRIDHAPRKFRSGLVPNGKERLKTGAFELFDSVGANVIQKQISESDMCRTAFDSVLESGVHFALVHFIGTRPGQRHDTQWEPDRASLRLGKSEAGRVHCNSFMGGIYGRQEADNFHIPILPEHMQRPSTVFAGTPGEQHILFHSLKISRG